jgi:diguanylate cyclase (GGDEF)-like protein/putative nucleotidyltransferase with HDIG domain
MALGEPLSVRRKTYLFVGATLLVAAVAIFAVSQAVFVREGGWTGDVLMFTVALIGVVLALGVAVCAILEGGLFRKLAKLTAQVRGAGAGGQNAAPIEVKGKDELALLAEKINAGFSAQESIRAEQEKQAQVLAEALEELKVRHSDLETAHRHLQQLQEASVSLGAGMEILDALGQMEEVALGIFEADEVWLLRLETDQQQLAGLRAFTNRGEGYAQLPPLFGCASSDGVLSVEGSTLLRTVFRGGGPVFIDSITELEQSELDRLFDGVVPDLNGFHSLAVVPLLAEDLPVGLTISAAAMPSRFTSDKKSTILLFASQVAQALEHNRLYEEIKALGEVDSLSGLNNRRRTLEQLDIEVARARRYEGTFSILLADIDNFKNFNDTYGHRAGDEVIKRVAGLLHSRNRSSDFVGRFGGDEFLMILPATYRAGAATVADHMRLALGSQPFMAPNGSPIPLRMNFGAASFPEDGHDAASLIAIADANLYESKRWGGDTVTLRREPVGGDTIDVSGFGTLDALVSAVDNKDHYTRKHCAHVAEQVAAMVKSLGLSRDRQEKYRVAALLHDVGKIGLPDRILRKPGSLTPEEEEAVRQHSLQGSLLISQYLPDDDLREAVLSHHERWDGTGYPAGLSGRNIPYAGRILAVADAYSAMITDRPYRAGLAIKDALAEITKGSGRQFDPEVVQVFLNCFTNGENPAAAKRVVVRGVPNLG